MDIISEEIVMAKWNWEKARAKQTALTEVTTFYVDVEDEDLGTLHYHFGNSTGVLHFSEDGDNTNTAIKNKIIITVYGKKNQKEENHV
jgi:hypothetical protein